MAASKDIVLTFDGKATAGHRLDAETVAASLLGVQKAMRMLASAEREGWAGDKRKYRPTRAVREQVVVEVSPPGEGSFVLPMTLAGDVEGAGGLVDTFAAFLEWLGGGDVVPDLRSSVLEHLLRTTLEWLPTRDDLFVRPAVGGRELPRLDAASRERAGVLLAERPSHSLWIKGEIIRAYLEEGEVRLRHPPSGRTFRLQVPDEVRGSLSLARGQWVEVFGTFRCDVHGEPVEIQDAATVRMPDLSPLAVTDFEVGGARLIIDPPLALPVTLDRDSHQLFVVEERAVGLHAFAVLREDLLEEVVDQLAFLWRAYATAPPEALAPDAVALRERILLRIREAT